MKKYLIIILALIVLTGPCLVLAQEYTAYDGPSDIEEEVENEGTYTYIEERDELEPGLFNNIIEEEESEEEYQIPGYLDYRSWQFWLLLIILSTIVLVLIRLIKNLSQINLEIKRHENYLEDAKVKKNIPISEEDEIIYSEPHDD